MRNIASLMLVLGIVAGLAPSGLAADDTSGTTAAPKTTTKTVKHVRKHIHKVGVSKTAAPEKTETKSDTSTETK